MLVPNSLITISELMQRNPTETLLIAGSLATLVLTKKTVTHIKTKKRQLIAKGLGRNTMIKAKLKKNGLYFYKYNLALTKTDFQSLKPWLEGLYNKQFKDPASRGYSMVQETIFFGIQNFKSIKQYDLIEKNKNRFFLGIDDEGKEITEDTQINNSLVIRGAQGAGKSQTIRAITLAFLKNNPEYKVISIDTKDQELGDLVEYVHKLEDVNSYIFLNKELEFIINHCEREESNNKFLLIFDEALDYLSKEIDPDPLIQEQKKILLAKLLKIIRKLRSSGVIVIIGVQDISASAIQIPQTLIKITLTSRISTKQQVQALGMSMDAMDSDLKAGRWILGKNKKVQFPEKINFKPSLKQSGVIDERITTK